VDPPSRTQPPLGQNQSAAAFKDSGRDIVSLTPGSRVGPYEIVGLVSAGGMGQVVPATADCAATSRSRPCRRISPPAPST
jgi:hypothetical protein